MSETIHFRLPHKAFPAGQIDYIMSYLRRPRPKMALHEVKLCLLGVSSSVWRCVCSIGFLLYFLRRSFGDCIQSELSYFVDVGERSWKDVSGESLRVGCFHGARVPDRRVRRGPGGTETLHSHAAYIIQPIQLLCVRHHLRLSVNERHELSPFCRLYMKYRYYKFGLTERSMGLCRV